MLLDAFASICFWFAIVVYAIDFISEIVNRIKRNGKTGSRESN